MMPGGIRLKEILTLLSDSPQVNYLDIYRERERERERTNAQKKQK